MDVITGDEQLEQGKIYFLDYGGNTQVLGRFKELDFSNYYFYDILHYWNGYETFRAGKQHCVKYGIDLIRRATKPEKHTLVKFEIENDLI